MINKDELIIGDTIYELFETVNFSRNKITFTDADGVEWSRYDKPLKQYEVREWVVIGLVVVTPIGTVTEEFNHLLYGNGLIAIIQRGETTRELWYYEYNGFYLTHAEANFTMRTLQSVN